MSKRLKLATRGLGAEPGIPKVAELAAWIAEHRGTAADLTTYRLFQSLSPQIAAGIGSPCAGGKFLQERILDCIIGVSKKRAIDELGVRKAALAEDGYGIAAQRRNAWCALPAPHALGIVDTYFNDNEEWTGAIAGAYISLMRTMRDAGVPGHVLICDKAEEPEVAVLNRREVFFFQPEPDRESLEVLMEHQSSVASGKDHLPTVFDLANEYDLRKILIVDADLDAINLALTHVDPDQVVIAGYCTEGSDLYWEELEKLSSFSR